MRLHKFFPSSEPKHIMLFNETLLMLFLASSALKKNKEEMENENYSHALQIDKFLFAFGFITKFNVFFSPLDPKQQQPPFQVPKFWHSISSNVDEHLDDIGDEENVGKDETTTHHEPLPFFEEEQTQVNETTQLGNDVYLHCRVSNLGEKTVREDDQR